MFPAVDRLGLPRGRARAIIPPARTTSTPSASSTMWRGQRRDASHSSRIVTIPARVSVDETATTPHFRAISHSRARPGCAASPIETTGQKEDRMPWSNQSGGGGGDPGARSAPGRGARGPQGGGGGGGGAPPDLEELLRRSQDRLRQVMPGGADGRHGPRRHRRRRRAAVAGDRLLHRAARRGRPEPDVRPLHRHHPAGPELQLALSDRQRHQAARHRRSTRPRSATAAATARAAPRRATCSKRA